MPGELIEQRVKTDEYGIEVTASIMRGIPGFYNLVVIHRFPSGNFFKKEILNQSEVAAKGLLHFYTGV